MGKKRKQEKHPIPVLKDGDLLRGDPPSLWGIAPLKTPIDDAREILRAKGVLNACTEYHYPQTGATGIACWPHFNLQHENGIVKFVEFRPSISLSIAQVIEERGTPDGVLSVYTDQADGSIQSILMLYYDAIWTTISLVEQPPKTGVVTPQTRVARITYSKPIAAVTNNPLRVAWAGYGSYPSFDATSG